MRFSGPATFRLLTLLWPALVVCVLYLFPGPDEQRQLERRLRSVQVDSGGPPVPLEEARQRPGSRGKQSGVRMFWEETGRGQFHGEIYIPPQELSAPDRQQQQEQEQEQVQTDTPPVAQDTGNLPSDEPESE